MKKIFILSFFLVISHATFSQHSSLAYQNLADSLYLHHHYPDAINYYERALKKSNESGKIMLQIAKSYLKINKVKEAHEWFEKARLNHVALSYNDTYEYINTLKMLGKRNEAVNVLQDLLKKDPDDIFAKETLDDLQNFKKYYKDSSAYTVESLSINTPSSDFAPAYYKEGIVFSSATPGEFGKKKYHWDHSNFLNLYFTKKLGDHNFSSPTLFEEELDTRYHDGPATFYEGFEKMIINRNQSFKTKGKEDTWLWHLALYDGLRSKEKKGWQFNALPFDEPPYSFAHPSISEDGTVLYFISDKPGGYGGTDIYRITHANGVWGKPFNLGPTINSPENEVFPFFINNTLYFASNGKGGLGGLDIFESKQTLNGFTTPVNLGYPINSTADDFSFIINPSLGTGYFSSARNGNDDLFSFIKFDDMVDMVAHVYDGETHKPLIDADVTITTTSGNDIKLKTDSAGLVHFELQKETGYVIIANKDDKTGLLAGFVNKDSKRLQKSFTHQVPSYADTTRILCKGIIHDQLGLAQNNSTVNITDETTGEILGRIEKSSIVNFMGKRGHTYRIDAQNEKGDTAVHKLVIGLHDAGPKTWTMTLKKGLINIAVRVLKADDNQPMGGATVKVITFLGHDQELIANEAGIAEFSLPHGTAYLAVGNKDNLTGMHSGIAEDGMDKGSIIHPIPMRGDVHLLPVIAKVMNVKGEIIRGVKATVTDKSTGEKISVEVKDGLITFLGEPGKDYRITAEHTGYQTRLEDISIPVKTSEVQKISFTLKDRDLQGYAMAVKVFKASNQEPLPNAEVRIVTYSDADQTIIANDEGIAEFGLPEKTPYVAIGNKDGYTGIHSGVVENGTGKESMTHPIAAHNDPENQLGIIGVIKNKDGDIVRDAHVTVTDKSTGKSIPVLVQDGLLSFMGEKGKSYEVTIDHKDFQSLSKEISIPLQATVVEKIIFSLEEKANDSSRYSMAARVFKVSDRLPVSQARVQIITSMEADQALTADQEGIVDFTLSEGTPFVLIADKDGYTGMYSGVVKKGSEKTFIIHPVATYNNEKQLPVVMRITNKQGKILDDAKVVVIDNETKQELPVQINNGLASFMSEKGKNYTITVDHNDYESASEQLNIPLDAVDPKKITFALEEKKSTPSDSYNMAVRFFKADDNQPLAGAKVLVMTLNSVDQELITNSEGVVDFSMLKGTVYAVVGYKDGYTGMFTSRAEPGTDKASVIHSVPSYGNTQNQIPIIGFITDENGTMLEDATVVVIRKDTGEKIPAQRINGVVSFMAEKGKDYTVTIEHKGYKSKSEEISIPLDATDGRKINFSLERESLQASTTIIVIKDNKEAKYYISSKESLEEIIEMDNTLYLKSDQASRALGKGSLAELGADPNAMILSFGISTDKVVTMENIYFDYNKASLKEEGKQQLDKAKDLLQRYPLLQLMIGAHADSRGADRYNLILSKKRAKTIESYLNKRGIKSNRIIAKAYGETAPAAPCAACSEEEYQKNRRAEFALRSGNHVGESTTQDTEPIVTTALKTELKKDTKSSVDEFFEKYGDKQIEELTFKLSIGAYRYNHTLTFDELKDLGTVESRHIDEITYYFLGDYRTLNVAKNIRQQVIKRGVTDTVISFFYKGEKISYATFLSLVE